MRRCHPRRICFCATHSLVTVVIVNNLYWINRNGKMTLLPVRKKNSQIHTIIVGFSEHVLYLSDTQRAQVCANDESPRQNHFICPYFPFKTKSLFASLRMAKFWLKVCIILVVPARALGPISQRTENIFLWRVALWELVLRENSIVWAEPRLF